MTCVWEERIFLKPISCRPTPKKLSWTKSYHSSFASSPSLLNRPPNWTIVKRVPATSSSLFSLFISFCHPLLPLAKTSFYFCLVVQFDQHHNQLRNPQLDCALLNILKWVLFRKKHFLSKKLLLSSFLPPLLSPLLDFATVHTRCLWIWVFGTEQ